MQTPFGYVFLLISLYFVFKANEKKRKIKACHGNRITATVVNNTLQQFGGAVYVYYPTYSYEKDGETYTYQSEFPSFTALQIGMEVPMYYNELTRKPIEVVSATIETTLAVVFGTVAMIML